MSYSCLYYHVVFSTKQRRPFLTEALRQRLVEYMGGITRNLKGKLLHAGGASDHVHLAVSLPATLAVSDYVRDVKSNSSSWIRKEFPDLRGFRWQDGHATFTAAPSVLPQLRRYLDSQEQHHRGVPFVEELKRLLDRHGVRYDPRHLG